jgi:hypothetical protein
MGVIFFPGRGELPRRRQVLEHFGGQELIAEPAVEALGVTVLPRRSWLNVQGLNCHLREPALDRPGDELGTVVAADMLGHAAHGEQLGQCVDDVLAGDAAIDLEAQTLPCVFIDD